MGSSLEDKTIVKYGGWFDVDSSIRSFIHEFIHALLHSFIPQFMNSLTHSLIVSGHIFLSSLEDKNVAHWNCVMLHIWMSLSHTWKSRVAHMNESCHTYEWDMLHIWMRHVAQGHIWMSHMLHTRMRHVAHVNEPCRTYEWVMLHIWMRHHQCCT